MDFTVENILIPAEHPCFEGHFPGHPIFPAVAQIDLVVDQLQRLTKRDLIVLAIRKAKFQTPIDPDTRVHVSLKIQDDIVFWKIFGNEKTYSQGTVHVAEPGSI